MEKTRDQMEGQKKDYRLLLGLIPIALIVWLTLGTIDAQMRVSLTSKLQTVLDTTRGGLRIGAAARKAHITAWAESNNVSQAVALQLPRTAKTLGIPFLTTTELDLGNGIISPTESSSMIVASPIRDAQGTVIAVLTYFLDPTMMDRDRGTTIIRPWEVDGQWARTPFVALTANAFREQVEKRLLAGCDAHLTKLIKKQTLLTALVQANTLTVRTQAA